MTYPWAIVLLGLMASGVTLLALKRRERALNLAYEAETMAKIAQDALLGLDTRVLKMSAAQDLLSERIGKCEMALNVRRIGEPR